MSCMFTIAVIKILLVLGFPEVEKKQLCSYSNSAKEVTSFRIRFDLLRVLFVLFSRSFFHSSGEMVCYCQNNYKIRPLFF